jgi:hypothetical protein
MAGKILTYPINGEIRVFPDFFTTTKIGIEIPRNNTVLDTWYLAGYLYPVAEIGGKFWDGIAIPIEFGGTIVDIRFRNYRLKFRPVDWLERAENLLIIITEVDISMGINAASSGVIPVDKELITTVATSSAVTQLRAENSTFCEGYIVNNSNKILYVLFADAPAITASAPFSAVPAKSNIDIPDNYTGVIQGIWSGNDNTGKAEIHQLNYK